MKILLIGGGSIGKKYLAIIREHFPWIEVLSLKRRNNHQGIGYKLDDSEFEKMLQLNPEYIILANPASMRTEIVEKVLRNTTMRLLIEKPISTKYSDFELWNSEPGTARRICVGYNLRFLPSLIKYRELILKGAVGTPISIRVEVGQYLPDWRNDINYELSVSARRELGGGVLFELSHELDYLTWIFGPPIWVSAWMGKVSGLKVNVEDTCFMTMAHKWGKDSADVISQVNLDMVRRDKRRGCTVIGERGTIKWDGLSGKIIKFVNGTWLEVYSTPESIDDTYVQQLKFLMQLNGIEGDKGESFQDAGVVLKTILAAQRSAKTGSKMVRIGS